MPESFLILLAAGVMLAAAICDPRAVTLHYLRLCGIIALAVGGLSGFFYMKRDLPGRAIDISLYAVTGASILAQLAFVQVDKRLAQRVFAAASFVAGVTAAALLLAPSSLRSFSLALLSSAGIAAMSGIALMDMLLGHAYLTASQMTIAPFRRLNLALAATLIFRIVCAVGLTLLLLRSSPIELFWDRYGILILTRWLVGLVVPAIFIYMAHDCIKRRSTQSATGILYVTGLSIFLGELVALYLVRETALPF